MFVGVERDLSVESALASIAAGNVMSLCKRPSTQVKAEAPESLPMQPAVVMDLSVEVS